MIQRGFDHDLSEAEKQHIIDLYDGCVFEFDEQVGAIVAELKKRGLLENTIVGVWGDHGTISTSTARRSGTESRCSAGIKPITFRRYSPVPGSRSDASRP